MANCVTRHIPNTITSLSLVCGCIAIIVSFCGMQGYGLQCWQWAWLLIGVGAVLDFCDGLAARLLHAKSAIGKELDSLADLVTFGVAPAMMIFNTMTAMSTDATWEPFVVVIVPVMGALRLARFNIDDSQTTVFRGLPIPSCAIFLIGFDAWIMDYGYPGHVVTMALVVLIALAMVCNLRMFSLKFKNLYLADNLRRYTIVIAAVAFVTFYGVAGLAWTILLYILISLFGSRSGFRE